LDNLNNLDIQNQIIYTKSFRLRFREARKHNVGVNNRWGSAPKLWQQNGNKKSDSVCFTDNTSNVDTLC